MIGTVMDYWKQQTESQQKPDTIEIFQVQKSLLAEDYLVLIIV